MPAGAGLPGRRPEPCARRPRRTGVDRRPRGRARPRRRGRARRRPRSRPDRPGGRARRRSTEARTCCCRPARAPAPARSRDRRRRCSPSRTQRRRGRRGVARGPRATGREVVVEATGVPELVQLAPTSWLPTGRVVVVGLSDREVPFRVGRPPFKEIDVLGVSCCTARSSPPRSTSSPAARRRGAARHPRVRPRAGAGGDRVRDARTRSR